MRRLGVAAAAALLVLSMFVQGGAVQAYVRDVEWCAEDPVIIVFGAQFKVVSTVNAAPSAVSSFAYTIEVPSNAVGRTIVNWPNGRFATTTVQVSYTGAAWSGSGPFTVSGTSTVTAPDGSAVTVSISGPTVATSAFGGTANSPVPFSTSVTKPAATDVSGNNGQ